MTRFSISTFRDGDRIELDDAQRDVNSKMDERRMGWVGIGEFTEVYTG